MATGPSQADTLPIFRSPRWWRHHRLDVNQVSRLRAYLPLNAVTPEFVDNQKIRTRVAAQLFAGSVLSASEAVRSAINLCGSAIEHAIPKDTGLLPQGLNNVTLTHSRPTHQNQIHSAPDEISGSQLFDLPAVEGLNFQWKPSRDLFSAKCASRMRRWTERSRRASACSPMSRSRKSRGERFSFSALVSGPSISGRRGAAKLRHRTAGSRYTFLRSLTLQFADKISTQSRYRSSILRELSETR